MAILDRPWFRSDWDLSGFASFSDTAGGIHGTTMKSYVNLGGGSTDKAEHTFAAARAGSSDYWFHFSVSMVSDAGDFPFCTLRGNGTDLFRLVSINTTEHWKVEYYNGSSWTQVGSDITTPAQSVFIDIHLNMDNSTGVFDVYLDGVQQTSLAGGDTIFTSETNITSVFLERTGTGGNDDATFSNFIGADEDTREMRISEVTTSSAGNYQQWSGSEIDVDDDGFWGGVDSTFITSDAANEKVTYNMIGESAVYDTDFDVVGVWSLVRARSVGTGLDLQSLLRISATDYNSSSQSLTGAFAEYEFEYLTDPSTASAWADATAVEAAEMGFEAI